MAPFNSLAAWAQGVLRPLIALAVLAFGAPSLRAADRYWITNGTGNFTSTANWSTTLGGAGGASVPTASDTAHFRNAAMPPLSYTVNFPRRLNFPLPVYAMNRARIENEIVRFADSGLLGSEGTVRISYEATVSWEKALQIVDGGELHTTLANFEVASLEIGVDGDAAALYLEGGTLTVPGTGSGWGVKVSYGLLSVTNGAHMNVPGGGVSVTNFGPGAQLLISGAGSQLTALGVDVGFLDEEGHLTVEQSGQLSTGFVRIWPGSMAVVTGPGSQWSSSETMFVEGELQVANHGVVTVANSLMLDDANAVVSGAGAIHADVESNGLFKPLYADGVGVGTLHIEGDYEQLSLAGRLEIELIDATRFGRLVVNGNMTLDGPLKIIPQAGVEVGDVYDILDWTTRTGMFSSVDVSAFPPSLKLDATDLYTTGVVRVVPTFLADFDLDADVDRIDLALWKGGFGATGSATRVEGDANGDLNVDGQDFLIWQRELGSLADEVATAVVPEPATVALLALGVLTSVFGRMREAS